MKRFIFQSIGFVLLLITVFAAADISLNSYARRSVSNPGFEDHLTQLVVGNSARPEIIITGDSRAQNQIDSEMVTQAIGKETVSVGAGALDLATVDAGLRAYGILGEHRLFIISVSSFQVNDGAIDTGIISPAAISRMTLVERMKIFRHHLMVWFYGDKQVLGYFLKSLFLKNSGRITETAYPHRGFVSVDRVMPLPLKDMVTSTSTSERDYSDPNFTGIRLRVFTQALSDLAASDDVFVIYSPPISPAWRDMTKGTFIDTIERDYGKTLAEESKKYLNVHYIDYYSDPNPLLTNDKYADKWHVNATGSKIFTAQVLRDIRNLGFEKIPTKNDRVSR